MERARAFDDHLDREARLTQVEAVREMNRRHVAEARAIQAKALEALRGLAPGELAPADLLRFLVEGSKLERLGLGEVTDRTHQDVEARGAVELAVVERIVPVRPPREPLPHAAGSPAAGPGASASPSSVDANSVDDFTFPDDPPAASLDD